MNLVQAQEKVSGDDLDVPEVESFASIDEIFKQIGWSRRKFELLLLLYFLQHSILIILRPLCFNFCHQRATYHASRLLGNEEEHVARLVHVLHLAQIYRLLQLSQSKCLAQDKLLLLFVELRLLDGCERVDLRKIRYLALLVLIWLSTSV